MFIYLTSSTIKTWLMFAFVCDSDFTILSFPSGLTRTSVFSLSGVVACSSVSARSVVGAIIQILVAKQTTPSRMAITFPWFGAWALLTAWVALAFVAKSSCPTITTSVRWKKIKELRFAGWHLPIYFSVDMSADKLKILMHCFISWYTVLFLCNTCYSFILPNT